MLQKITRKSIETKSLIRNYRKVKEGCECPEPKPKYEIVEEKRCPECSFACWKPKPRKVIECEIKKSMQPKPPIKCYAGMSFQGKVPTCKSEDIDPFKKNCCLKTKTATTEKTRTRPPQTKIPAADWDMDCNP